MTRDSRLGRSALRLAATATAIADRSPPPATLARVGLGAMVFLAGVHKLAAPAAWTQYVTDWLAPVLVVSPTTFMLVEDLNVSGILASDPEVEDETVMIEGEEQVVYAEDDTYQPLSEYLRDPGTVQFEQGEHFDYLGNETNVSSVTADAATLTWTAPRDKSVSASEGANVTLGDTTYLAHFPSGSEVILSTNFEEYQHEVEQGQYFTERVNGLWGVSILSGLTAILLLGLAYLPSRY